MEGNGITKTQSLKDIYKKYFLKMSKLLHFFYLDFRKANIMHHLDKDFINP